MSAKKGERVVLPLADLVPHALNSNVVPEDVLVKLERNIKRTGHYPPLLVQYRVDEKGKFLHYRMIDGHHRKMILERLGFTEANVEVWHVTDREADVMLASLNTLRGTDDLRARAALIDSLLATVPIDQLAGMLPEDEAGLLDLQRLTQIDLDALEASAKDTADKNDAESPTPRTFILYPEQYVKVDAALEHVKKTNDLHGKKNSDGMALYYMAVEYLSGAGWEEAEEQRMDAEPPIGSGA